MKNLQVRLRLPPDIAWKLRSLPIPLRNQVVAVMLRAQADKIDLLSLVSMRRELSSLGTLINQSLRTSWGRETDQEAVTRVVSKLQELFAP